METLRSPFPPDCDEAAECQSKETPPPTNSKALREPQDCSTVSQGAPEGMVTVKTEPDSDRKQPPVSETETDSSASVPLRPAAKNNPNTLGVNVTVGDRVEVFWPSHKAYFRATATQQSDESTFYLEYDDGDEEWTDLSVQTFRMLKPSRRCGPPERFSQSKYIPTRRGGKEQMTTSNEIDVYFTRNKKSVTKGTAEYRKMVKEMARSHEKWSSEVYSAIRGRLGEDRRFWRQTVDDDTGSKIWQTAKEEEVEHCIRVAFLSNQRRSGIWQSRKAVSSHLPRLTSARIPPSTRSPATVAHPVLIKVPQQRDICFVRGPNPKTKATSTYRSLVKNMARSHRSGSAEEVYKIIRNQLGLDRRFLVQKTAKSDGHIWQVAQEKEVKARILSSFSTACSRQSSKAKSANQQSGIYDQMSVAAAPRKRKASSAIPGPDRASQRYRSEQVSESGSFTRAIVGEETRGHVSPPPEHSTTDKIDVAEKLKEEIAFFECMKAESERSCNVNACIDADCALAVLRRFQELKWSSQLQGELQGLSGFRRLELVRRIDMLRSAEQHIDQAIRSFREWMHENNK